MAYTQWNKCGGIFKPGNVVVQKQRIVPRQLRKPTKIHPLGVAKKYMEMYFASNAVAPEPDERVQKK